MSASQNESGKPKTDPKKKGKTGGNPEQRKSTENISKQNGQNSDGVSHGSSNETLCVQLNENLQKNQATENNSRQTMSPLNPNCGVFVPANQQIASTQMTYNNTHQNNIVDYRSCQNVTAYGQPVTIQQNEQNMTYQAPSAQYPFQNTGSLITQTTS